ncbi:MAG TPA: phospholipid carrier-dependent glycosyltransferase [Patescibacteria group bacterium]|jgi:dolichyl-phosphate-mannose--protein O-mannosyl transferase
MVKAVERIRKLTRRDWYLIGGLTFLALLLRFINLDHPPKIIFDETYFAVFAQNYLTGTEFFDAEPPLGKFLVAGGEWLFGNDSFGWRSVPALFGTAVVPLMYLLAKRLFGGTVVPLFAGALALLDGFLLVESRTAVLDGFVIVFNLATYLFFVQSLQAADHKTAFRWLAATGVTLGLGLSLKWITLAFVAPAAALLLVLALRDRRWVKQLFKVRSGTALLDAIGAKKENLFSVGHYLAWLGLVPVLTYLGLFAVHVPFDSTGEDALGIHRQIFNYHHNLEATHPYGSAWYTWPLMIRPVAYFFESANNQWQGIIAMGNPIVWWSGLAAVGFAAWRFAQRRSLVLGLLLVAILAHFGPWALIDRVLFIYHYAGALPFVILALAYALGRSWEWRPADPWPQAVGWFLLIGATGVMGTLLGQSFGGLVPVPAGVSVTLGALAAVIPVFWLAATRHLGWRWGKKQAVAFLWLTVLAFVYFYPVWTGLGLDVQDYNRRMWLKSWI